MPYPTIGSAADSQFNLSKNLYFIILWILAGTLFINLSTSALICAALFFLCLNVLA